MREMSVGENYERNITPIAQRFRDFREAHMAVAYLLSIRPEIALDYGNASVTIAHGRGSGVPGSERM